MTADLSRRTAIAAGLATLGAGAGGARVTPVAPPRPYGATPSARQWAWAGREMYAFVHFAMNTFTDKEWGYGDEDPALFNPSDFDADQIVSAIKAGGLRGLILTAKHHDGFCLWPTPLTEHCVRNSPFRGGKGDVVREIEQACRRAGLPFGLYLSPWDRNHPDYGRPAYIDYYRAQLTDLCTHYGDLFEVWFDGANGGDGYYGGARETRKIDAPRYYDWPSIVALVHRLQPMACTFDPRGADIRWIGNEDGRAGDPCWPTMPDREPSDAERNTGVRGGPIWWPGETDVSIRPGWFYHSDEDEAVKSPARLVTLYDESVARGTNLILNVPPDRRGRVADPDIASLAAFGDAIRASFGQDLARAGRATASAERGAGFAAANVLDGDRNTYWSTPDGDTRPSLEVRLPRPARFDLIRLREYLPLGIRVTRFAVDVDQGGAWREVAAHEAIGAQRVIRLPAPVDARGVRLRILDAPVCPAISEVALFLAVAPRAVAPVRRSEQASLDRSGWRVAAASAPGAEAVLDGDARTAWIAAAPATLTLDMTMAQRIAGVSLTPTRHPTEGSGPPRGYRIEGSADGRTWRVLAEGEFSNIAYARATQRVRLGVPVTLRYLRMHFAAAATGDPKVAIAEIGAIPDQTEKLD